MAEESESARIRAENQRKLQEHLERLKAHGGKPPPEPEPPPKSARPKEPPKPPPRPPGWDAWKRVHGNRMHQLHARDDAQLARDADYKLLELKPGASKDEIKRSFNSLAKEYHPDKGGDPEIFQAMLAAYKRLTQ